MCWEENLRRTICARTKKNPKTGSPKCVVCLWSKTPIDESNECLLGYTILTLERVVTYTEIDAIHVSLHTDTFIILLNSDQRNDHNPQTE